MWVIADVVRGYQKTPTKQFTAMDARTRDRLPQASLRAADLNQFARLWDESHLDAFDERTESRGGMLEKREAPSPKAGPLLRKTRQRPFQDSIGQSANQRSNPSPRGNLSVMEGKAFDAMVCPDIKANGLREGIVLLGTVIDGPQSVTGPVRRPALLRLSPSAVQSPRAIQHRKTVSTTLTPMSSAPTFIRRNLLPTQKREMDRQVIKSQPKKSDRRSPSRQGQREERGRGGAEEARGGIPHASNWTDTKGGPQQAAKKEARGQAAGRDKAG